MSKYTEQADKFLKDHNLEFRAVLVGNDCPAVCDDALAERDMDKVNTFPRKTHIHGKHYRCTISGTGRGHISFDFWNSYADEEENYFTSGGFHGQITPVAYDLLAAIQKNDVGTFEEFCADFGYDTDSRRAEQVYNAVCKEWAKVRKFFTADELTELQEIN